MDYCERLRCSLTDSKEWAYALSSRAAFSDSWESVEDVLFMEQRLEWELDGLRVLGASVLPALWDRCEP